jgi:hypothetical protein
MENAPRKRPERAWTGARERAEALAEHLLGAGLRLRLCLGVLLGVVRVRARGPQHPGRGHAWSTRSFQ